MASSRSNANEQCKAAKRWHGQGFTIESIKDRIMRHLFSSEQNSPYQLHHVEYYARQAIMRKRRQAREKKAFCTSRDLARM
jgi:hypothetical protein